MQDLTDMRENYMAVLSQQLRLELSRSNYLTFE